LRCGRVAASLLTGAVAVADVARFLSLSVGLMALEESVVKGAHVAITSR
jgi:hypothetical protein